MGGKKRKAAMLKPLKRKIRKLERKVQDISSSSDEISSSSSSSEESDQKHDSDSEINEIQTLLGADPNSSITEGPDIAEDISTRWKSYLTKGIEGDTRLELIEKWKFPANCKALKAPKLNLRVSVDISTSRSEEGSIPRIPPKYTRHVRKRFNGFGDCNIYM
nr:unnamed protein product [Callosobruchus analis]